MEKRDALAGQLGKRFGQKMERATVHDPMAGRMRGAQLR